MPQMTSWPCRAALLCAALLAAPGAATAPQRIAVFDFRLDDTSLQGSEQGTQPAETARLDRLRPALSDLLEKSGAYQPVDITPVAAKAKAADLQSCGGCAEAFGKQLGARYVVIGWVQKVSNLILNINAQIVDVQTGQVVRAGSVDIRGNTDESWARGLRYLAKNRLLEPAATP